MKSSLVIVVCAIILFCSPVNGEQKIIVVSPDGKGDCQTIQAAIASLDDSSSGTRTIYIRKGIYREKVYIEKHNITFEGEDREGVIITAAILRDEWRCRHKDDWGVATINVEANDITFKNITVINSYGSDYKEVRNVNCSDSRVEILEITPVGHQMAVRTMTSTRFKAINCYFKSYGGDTMSPWNVGEGLFYFKDCIMEGGVDLYCPRGYAYAENCKFISKLGSAVIWHDGSYDKNSKSVLVNCTFDGYKGFQLGRYHRDAQFYLINCSFSENMADNEIYRAPAENAVLWGHRVYYYNCHRIGGDYLWFADNISTVVDDPKIINASWVFGNKWNSLKN